MKVAGYGRASTIGQVEDGHSLDAQEHAIVEFCRSRGWTLVEIYVDPGLSGALEDRPALQRLLKDAAQGKFDVVVVHAIDRFYRDLQGLLSAFKYLQNHNVSFISITENLDFTTPWGKLTLAVLGTLAEIYLDKLSAETSKGKQARARKGLYNGSIPFGYCKGNCADCDDPNGPGYCPRYGGPSLRDQDPSRPLWLHPVESVAMQLGFEWYATGEYSDGDIARRLNRHEYHWDNGHREVLHFRTKGRHGRGQPGPFGKESVRSLMQRPFYTGVVAYYGTDENGQKKKRATALHPGQHPALVDQETFDRCQEIRRARGHARRSRDNGYQTRVYLLSGLLRCGQCGEPMRALSSVSGIRYYRCTTRIEHRGECKQKQVRADDIEAQVVDLLRGLELPPDWQARLLASASPPQELARRDAERERLQTRLERTRELYLAGDIDRERYVKEQTDCQQKLADLTNVTGSGILSAAQLFELSDEEWAGLTKLQKRSLVQFALARATLVRDQLRAVRPTYAAYPLIRLTLSGERCLSGSDGRRAIVK
jgi:site-specific DNA recombinase